MADPILVLHLNSIETELKNLITEYYFQLTGIQINFDTKDIKNLITFIKDSPLYKPEHFMKNLEKSAVLDFNTLIDTVRFLQIFSINENVNKNISTFTHKLTESLCNELKNFRNLIHHNKIIEDEIIQRFFEDVYFFFKYVKLPNEKDIYSDYLKKEINMAIKCSMRLNIQKQNSFTFDLFKINDIDLDNRKILNSIKKKAIKDNNTKNINRGITDYEQNEFEYIFQNNIKTQVLDFNLQLNYLPNASFSQRENEVNYPGESDNSDRNKKNKNICYDLFQKIIDNDGSMEKSDKLEIRRSMSQIEQIESRSDKLKSNLNEEVLDDTLDLNNYPLI